VAGGGGPPRQFPRDMITTIRRPSQIPSPQFEDGKQTMDPGSPSAARVPPVTRPPRLLAAPWPLLAVKPPARRYRPVHQPRRCMSCQTAIPCMYHLFLDLFRCPHPRPICPFGWDRVHSRGRPRPTPPSPRWRRPSIGAWPSAIRRLSESKHGGPDWIPDFARGPRAFFCLRPRGVRPAPYPDDPGPWLPLVGPSLIGS